MLNRAFFHLVHSPVYDGPTYPSWLRQHSTLPWVDAVACRTAEGLTIAVVNRSDKKKAKIEVEIGGTEQKRWKGVAYTVGGHPDVKNTFESQPVGIVESSVQLEGSVEIEPSTLTVYVLDVDA